MLWATNYKGWWGSLRSGDLHHLWRPQYFYGVAVAAASFMILTGTVIAAALGQQSILVAGVCFLASVLVVPTIWTAGKHRAIRAVPQLLMMYGAFGFGAASSLLTTGWRKKTRWRN
jgi:hypothetical protein